MEILRPVGRNSPPISACNVVAGVAFAEHTADKIKLQPLVYGRIRGEFGLSAINIGRRGAVMRPYAPPAQAG